MDKLMICLLLVATWSLGYTPPATNELVARTVRIDENGRFSPLVSLPFGIVKGQRTADFIIKKGQPETVFLPEFDEAEAFLFAKIGTASR